MHVLSGYLENRKNTTKEIKTENRKAVIIC